MCQGYNAPWAKGCATCWAKALAASVAPWYRGGQSAPKAEAVYSPPDSDIGNLARAIGEQLSATRAGLASLQRRGIS